MQTGIDWWIDKQNESSEPSGRSAVNHRDR